MRGKAYPVIWLDNDGHPAHEHTGSSANVNRLKDTLLGRAEASIDSLRNYLKVWLASAKGCPCIPFVQNDHEDEFAPSADYQERREETMSVLRQTFFSDAPISEEKAGEA